MNLNIFYLHEDSNVSPEQLSEKLAAFPTHQLSNDSWPDIATICTADFTIAYRKQEILLKFRIYNDYFRSIKRPINTEVHFDNCVEFFIAFDQSDQYYNIEFNCLGIGKIAYGSQKDKRTLLQESVVQKIHTWTKSNTKEAEFNWEMMMSIPADVFSFHQIQSFEGLSAKANFYKCGDGLPNPHFLCWNKIVSATPDFHSPDYFGTIQFMPAQAEPGSFK